jgi:hypothetical protein
VSGSEAASVETTKEASTAAPAEETKKAEEVPVAPAPVAPNSVVVAPAPPVEPAPAPVVPAPAVPEPAAPVAPQAETPAAPAKDAVIDDPAPVVVVPPAEAEIPPSDPAPVEDATPVVNVSVMITTEKEINAQGWIFFSVTTQNVAPGTDVGTYQLNLTGAEYRFTDRTTLIVGENGTTSSTLYWQCATPGATISITGPDGLMPIFNEITGTTATVQTLPILGTPGCGTTTPTKTVLKVTPGAPTFIPAGPGKHGSIEYPGTVGVVYTADPAGATEGPVKVTATAAPETADTIYVIAPGAQTEWSGNLGEFSEEVPNPGVNPEFVGGGVVNGGKTSPATLIPVEGPFNQPLYVFPVVTGNTKDGSPVTVTLPKGTDPIETRGGSSITVQLDLTGLCGTAHWTWYAKADTDENSDKWIVGSGIVTGMPACDPQGGDDGGDNENPNPNPNPDPSHPGHGHGHGDDDGDHGDHDGCISRNHHSCEPGNNGPVGNPGDLNNGGVEADASANNVVVQSSSVEELGMGNAVPSESDLSNAESSYTGELAETGANDSWLIFAVILLGAGAVLVVLASWRRPRPQSRRRADVPQVK